MRHPCQIPVLFRLAHDPAADVLLSHGPFAVLVGMLLDQHKPIPVQQIHGRRAARIASHDSRE